YLNAELTRLFSEDSGFDYNKEEVLFKTTFKLAYQSLKDDAFKKYNHDKIRYEGAISLPVFEALAPAISSLIEGAQHTEDQIKSIIVEKTKALTAHERFIATLDKRVRPLDRMIEMAELGKELFK
ncbi:TPA: hypothetical protein ACSP3N_004224, partial [Aeromonas veronii]